MLYLRLAIENIFLQFKRFIISVLIIAISIIVIIYSVILYESKNYGYRSCDQILTQGLEKTGIFRIESMTDFDELQFQKDICNTNEVYTVGCLESVFDGFSEEIGKIQQKNLNGFFTLNTSDIVYGEDIKCIYMDINGTKICDFSVSEGISPEEIDFESEKINSYVYLGSAYESIPTGTVFSVPIDQSNVITYKIVGKLNDNQKLVNPELYNCSFETIDYTVDCKYGVICINKSLSPFVCWFSANDGYSIEEAAKKVCDVADKYGIRVTYTTLRGWYDETNTDTVRFLSYIMEAFEVIIPAIILMLITLQIVSIKLELNTYGIMYSIGFCIKDMSIMIIIRNIIMLIIALGMSTPIMYWTINYIYKDSSKEIMNMLLYSIAVPTAVIVIIIIMLITSVTSIIILNKYTPVKLMGMRE